MTQQETNLSNSTPEDVSAEWMEDHLPGVFIKYHPYMIQSERKTAEAVIEAAGVKPGFNVIDIGSGSGIPSLTIAEVVGPSGHVTATDPSPQFIKALKANASALGLTNFDVVQTSAAQLPFPPESFDAATCHFGAMFFPDVRVGLSRIKQVLRPGAKAGFVAWGPVEKNALFGPGFGVTSRYMPSAPPPDQPISEFPNPMRFSEPGTLEAHLRAVGFKDVREESKMVDLQWPTRSDQLAQMWFEMRNIKESVDPSRWDALNADLQSAYNRFAEGDTLRLPVPIVIASGVA
jgi:ubiquinone/menaquinone biosynthesis C-methylase UbiE